MRPGCHHVVTAAGLGVALLVAGCGPLPTRPHAGGSVLGEATTTKYLAAYKVGNSAPSNRAPSVAEASCGRSERTIYSCLLKKATVAICATPTAVTYRFGGPGAGALQIHSSGSDGAAHLGTLRGPGRGGEQISLRFSNNGYDYIVYSAVGGTLTTAPGKQWSGLVVMQGPNELSNLHCPVRGKQQRFGLDDVPSFVPDENRSELLAWF